MMYNNNLVACVKVDGKVLREKNSTVELPFGTEYSILLKNLNSKRVVVNIEIDGVDIGNGNRLVINPNQSLNLERYISSEHKFKFIEKTEQISNYRGNRPDDGLIRIIYSYEKEIPIINPYWWETYITCNDFSSGNKKLLNTYTTNCTDWTTQEVSTSINTNMVNTNNISASNIDGITVPGSKSEQNFIYIDNVEVENEYHVIILSLVGYKKQKEQLVQVQKPILVQTKLVCPTCGKRCSSNDNFCTRCGTALN